jgi:hypothetical protein
MADNAITWGPITRGSGGILVPTTEKPLGENETIGSRLLREALESRRTRYRVAREDADRLEGEVRLLEVQVEMLETHRRMQRDAEAENRGDQEGDQEGE